jgi:hypothetical protein
MMRARGTRTRIVSLAMAVLVWGCCSVPAGKFKALADSASQLGQAGQQADNQTIQAERYWLVVAQTSGDLKPESFSLESAFDPQNGEHPLGDKDLGARIAANGVVLTVIANYLAALSSFASQDFQGDLDKNATKLAGSVKSFGSLRQPWAKEAAQSSGALATAIDALGHAYIEHERIVALSRTMTSVADPLQQLVNFVITNNSVVHNALTRMETHYLDDVNLLRPRTPGAQRLAFDAYIAQAVGQFSDAQKTLTGIDQAIANLPSAHQELARSMCTPNADFDSLQRLIGEAERLSKFYASVK